MFKHIIALAATLVLSAACSHAPVYQPEVVQDYNPKTNEALIKVSLTDRDQNQAREIATERMRPNCSGAEPVLHSEREKNMATGRETTQMGRWTVKKMGHEKFMVFSMGCKRTAELSRN